MSGAMEGTEGLRRFQPYPEYKDSGVNWLAEVPSHWTVERMKRTTPGCQNGVWGDEPDGEHDLACLRVADFDRTSLRVRVDEPTLRSIEPRAALSRMLKPGELLIEKSGGGEKQLVGAVVLFDHEIPAVCSNFVARMPVSPGYDPRFVCYLHATAYGVRLNLRSIKQSTGIQNLDSEAYLNELAAIPALSEQRAIAEFLDRETGKIDGLVAKKERLIELLQEKRTALITHAVTKGLDPTAPTKASGIDWLGDIPAHWEAMRTKFVARLESGHTPSRQHPEYWVECRIPWFGLADVWQIRDGRREYVLETAENVSELGLANSSARLLPKGTVILSRTASVGFSAIMATDMATTQDFANWVPGAKIRSEFLLYVFRGMGNEFRRLVMGSTHKTIYMPDIGGFSTPVPPIAEQKNIIQYIRDEAEQIDALVGRVGEVIEHLREFRTSLISAAVTGKIDVRDEAA